jgi:hypothetical protein
MFELHQKYKSQAENVDLSRLLDNTVLSFFQKQSMNLDFNYNESKCVKKKLVSYCCLCIIYSMTNNCTAIVYGR